jgi:hypothetical protein
VNPPNQLSIVNIPETQFLSVGMGGDQTAAIGRNSDPKRFGEMITELPDFLAGLDVPEPNCPIMTARDGAPTIR